MQGKTSLEIKISMRLNESSKNQKCTKDGVSAQGRRDVCLGKVAGVWREEISLALNTTLLLFPQCGKHRKGMLQLPESQVSKIQASKVLRDPSRKAYKLPWAWTTKKSQKA